MSSDAAFSAKIVVFTGLCFAVTLWILDGAPLPVIAAKPLEPSAEVPTFSDVAAEAHERQMAEPRSQEEWELENVVSDIIIGSVAYRFQRCDASTRAKVSLSVGDYMLLRLRNPDLTLKPRMVEHPRGDFLLDDKKVEAVIKRMFRSGQLTLDDFSGETRAALQAVVTEASAEKQQRFKECQGLT